MAASGPAGSRRLDFLDVAENILQVRQRLDAPIHLCAQYDDGFGQQKAEPAEEAVINAVLAADGMSGTVDSRDKMEAIPSALLEIMQRHGRRPAS